MPTFTFENQGANSYLVYAVTPTDRMDTMSMGMLVNNDIPGLAPMIYHQLDEQRLLKYQISSKVSVAQFLEGGTAKKKQMVGLLTGIANALAAIEDYMLDLQYILLDANYMYIDVSSYQTQLICLPVMEQKNTVSLGEFLKNLIFNTQYDQSENCDYVAKMVNFLNRSMTVTPEAVRRLVNELQKESQAPNIHAAAAGAVSQTISANTAAVKPAVPNQGGELYRTAPAKAAAPSAAAVPRQETAVGTLPQQNISVSDQAVKPEKQITWFKLMCHYNKENAALYKAQKAQKKASKVPKKKKGKEEQPQFAMPNMPPMPSQPAASSQSAAPLQPVAPPQPAAPLQPATPSQPAAPARPPMPPAGTFAGQSNQSFGETTILGGGGFAETTILGGESRAASITPYLIRYKTNEKIMLNKPIFRIGKERSYVDYFIGDNAAVSRSHANIITREQQYCIVDTNSTNHTFVNNRELVSNVEVALEHGSKIRLANEEFEFRLY